jgi:NTE family protein
VASQVAFVLGGGGNLGAYEVGMLRALVERGITPDLVVGTSIGAINGASIAADPSAEAVDRLEEVWTNLDRTEVFASSILSQAANLVRTKTHLHSNRPLRKLLTATLPAEFSDLQIPFQCVAASIERAAEHWFSEGPLVDAILASCAIPGILPPVKIGEEHFIDGGTVNSIPIGHAVELGARVVYVLHVGRIERPLSKPRNIWEAAMVAFEVARRHRVARDLTRLPEGTVAHVLPTGETEKWNDPKQLRYRNFGAASGRIRQAYEATSAYLEAQAD